MYRVKNEFIPEFYSNAQTDEINAKQESGWTLDELSELAREWAMEFDDPMQRMEEI